MNKKLLRKAFLDTVPVMTGYLVLGIGGGTMFYMILVQLVF
jgi:branched-subunit amino acid transport protein AzlD